MSRELTLLHHRYLLNGNILAARAFLSQLVSQFASTRADLVSPVQSSPVPVGKPVNGHQDEVVLTKDPLVNFAQLALRTCQRAQGDRNKAVREAWVRLCGTYQSKGGLLAIGEVRKVRFVPHSLSSDDSGRTGLSRLDLQHYLFDWYPATAGLCLRQVARYCSVFLRHSLRYQCRGTLLYSSILL